MFPTLLMTGGKWEFRLHWIFYKQKYYVMLKVMIKIPIMNLFSHTYGEDVKKLKIFLKRSLEYSQFTNRCSSISQKNPPN